MGLSQLTEPCFVDANIFLFIIWDDDRYGPSCKEFLNQVEEGEISMLCTRNIGLHNFI